MKVNYIVKPEIGLVVCEIQSDGNYKKFRGVAKCAPEDNFNEELGKQIAKRRALIKYKKNGIMEWKESAKVSKYRYTSFLEDYNYCMKKVRKLEYSVGLIETEIDNLIEIYTNEE